MISVVIVCAGKGTRMNVNTNKILLPLEGKPIFMHSVDKFKKYTSDIVVVSNSEDYEVLKEYHSNVVVGGATRQESVRNGVEKTLNNRVLIHDGARPFITEEDIIKMINLDSDVKSAFLGSKLVDSIKSINEYENLNREEYVLAYTPQLVDKDLYLDAFNLAKKENKDYSDDVTLIGQIKGIKPLFVQGDRSNKKITTNEDYLDAVKNSQQLRIGYSWDTHKLVEGRKLILGGVEIPHHKGLLGHSDADALLHAIAESLLGALSLGDLGSHFPDNDPKYKGIDSKVLLRHVYDLILEKGYTIVNIDTMVYAEEPKMKPYIPLMRESISNVLNITVDQISIKATTYEKMDAIGRKEAIACDSTVLLRRK